MPVDVFDEPVLPEMTTQSLLLLYWLSPQSTLTQLCCFFLSNTIVVTIAIQQQQHQQQEQRRLNTQVIGFHLMKSAKFAATSPTTFILSITNIVFEVREKNLEDYQF